MTSISWWEPCPATEVHVTARVWYLLTVSTLKQQVCQCCGPLVTAALAWCKPHHKTIHNLCRKCLFAIQNMGKRNTPAGHLVVIQMRFSMWEMGSWSLKPFVISLFALPGFFSQMELSVKLQRKWSCSRNRKGVMGASSKRWDFTRLKKSRLLIMGEQLCTAPTVGELFCLSWRLVVAKHLRAKMCFSLSFVFLCLSPSAQPEWLLLLMLSASFFLVVFSTNKPLSLLAETLNTSLPVHRSIFHQERSHRLHKVWMMWLYVESYELPTNSSKTHIYMYSYVGRALGSTLNKVKLLGTFAAANLML